MPVRWVAMAKASVAHHARPEHWSDMRLRTPANDVTAAIAAILGLLALIGCSATAIDAPLPPTTAIRPIVVTAIPLATPATTARSISSTRSAPVVLPQSAIPAMPPTTTPATPVDSEKPAGTR